MRFGAIFGPSPRTCANRVLFGQILGLNNLFKELAFGYRQYYGWVNEFNYKWNDGYEYEDGMTLEIVKRGFNFCFAWKTFEFTCSICDDRSYGCHRCR